jgi:LuxR family transcriptional regulator, maltose regulon positive regulatory protein
MGNKADLEIPAGRRHIIERPRLTRLLDETTARVIMLVAPAGYGKTTLARQWLATRPHAWYQANPGSSDVAALALDLATTTSGMSSHRSRRLDDWLRTTREPEQDVPVAARLLSEHVNACPDGAVLVIDDYQMLASPSSEELVGSLLAITGIRLLITSRRRPNWATPRRLLYGEISEIGQSILAMSHEEAVEVLALGNDDGAAGALVALANGWPAVIGLAAFADLSSLLAEDALPVELHDYVAEELYASVDPEVRIGLCELSLLPTINEQLSKELLGGRASPTVTEGARAGFLAPGEGDRYELHPLLRSFLIQKLESLDVSVQEAAVGRAFHILLRLAAWEEAFELLARFHRSDMVEPLVTAALDDLVRQGRLETLRSWIRIASAKKVTSPIFELLEAECAFRKGLHERARTLAHRAAEALGSSSPLTSKAFYRAGQSAHLTDAPEDAIESFCRARALAQTPNDVRNALWGAFITNVELERPEASDLLDDFVAAGTGSVDDVVRVHNGRLYLATRFGPLEDAIARARPVTSLVPDAGDPIVRLSFWHIYAASLRLAAHYDEAQEAVAEGLKESRAFALDFAQPHMLLTSAAALIGVRAFRQAAAILDRVQRLSERQADEYLTMSTRAMRCRLLLTEGSPEAALSATSGSLLRVSSKGHKAEFLASRALAYARIGELNRARGLVNEATGLSGELEAVSLCRWTNVLLDLQGGSPDIDKTVIEVFEETLASGMLDMFVFAYRLDPRVLEFVAGSPSYQEILSELLTRASDRSLAREAGFSLLPIRPVSTRARTLTTREEDVYELLLEGRSNKQIAQALFLSEVTVKAHMRSIFRKLGVHTRTEAAVLATRTGLLSD